MSYISRIKRGNVKAFSFVELIGEWAISGFAGLLTAYICIDMELSWNMTAFFTGTAGHMGGRAIYMLEAYARKRFPMLDHKVQELSEENDDDNV